MPRAPLGLYLHIPFCSAICGYCNFNRGLLDAALKTRYVRALEREIATTGSAGLAADTIYFGGGTPSLLEAEEVARLIEACRGRFAVAPDAEVTLEANPETVTPETLAAFRQAGVNRLSFGVQSFRDEELKRLGRIHDARRARAAFADARRAGFDNISLDLMLWLPGQTRQHVGESVAGLIELAPEHASLYLLELYPNAPLREDMARAGWSLAPDDDAAEMYISSMETLEAAGYEQYEISNVARPGRRSRHNMKYWSDGEWAGFGCGAHSTIGCQRWNNVASIVEYAGRMEAGEEVAADRRTLSRRERIEEALFMGLRVADGISTTRFARDYGIDIWATWGGHLERCVDAGLLVHESGRLRLTRHGMLLSNEVLIAFLERSSTVK